MSNLFKKTTILSLFFILVISSCSKEDDDSLSGTTWKAKIDMKSVVLPDEIDKNEQHYFELRFSKNTFSLDIADSNGVIVLHDNDGEYSFDDQKINSKLSMIYYPKENYIYVGHYGMNFIKQLNF